VAFQTTAHEGGLNKSVSVLSVDLAKIVVMAGKNEFNWNLYNENNRKVSTGTYFFQLETGNHVWVQKVVALKWNSVIRLLF